MHNISTSDNTLTTHRKYLTRKVELHGSCCGTRLTMLFAYQACAAFAVWLWLTFGVVTQMAFLPFLLPVNGRTTSAERWFISTCLLAVALLLYVMATIAAYHVYGAVDSLPFGAVLVLYTVPLWLHSRGHYRWSIGIALAIALIAAAQTVPASYRLWNAHKEVERIVAFVDSEHARMGSYPQSLDHYQFRKPAVKHLIQYIARDGAFSVFYHAENKNAPHWYQSDLGWGYYDD